MLTANRTLHQAPAVQRETNRQKYDEKGTDHPDIIPHQASGAPLGNAGRRVTRTDRHLCDAVPASAAYWTFTRLWHRKASTKRVTCGGRGARYCRVLSVISDGDSRVWAFVCARREVSCSKRVIGCEPGRSEERRVGKGCRSGGG